VDDAAVATETESDDDGLGALITHLNWEIRGLKSNAMSFGARAKWHPWHRRTRFGITAQMRLLKS